MNATTPILTAFLQTTAQAPPGGGLDEGLLLLAAGVGLIILVFVLRLAEQYGKRGENKPNKFADFTK
jgi:hypothetical protein